MASADALTDFDLMCDVFTDRTRHTFIRNAFDELLEHRELLRSKGIDTKTFDSFAAVAFIVYEQKLKMPL